MAVVFADPFSAPGRWYKGNLHTHTTESDGKLAPNEVIRRYREAGYDFLSLTDHNRVTVIDEPPGENFLLLLGVEMDAGRTDIGGIYHVVGFGLTHADKVPRYLAVPKALAWIEEHGGEALIAHPYWSALVASDLVRQPEGHLGIEVFNTGCLDLGRAYSSVHWDDVLSRGLRFWGFAVDDAHHAVKDRLPTDTARAWVMVKAPELTREAILESLRRGLFYASWGPTIEDIAIHDGEVSVRTSPVKEINFIAQSWFGAGHFPMEAPALTNATYRLTGEERYLRVECRDAEGRWAWSNPIYFAE